MATTFARGAKPSSRGKLLGSTPYHATTAPVQFAVVPKQISFWDNNKDGCCVTTEEAYAIACYSTMLGLPELFVPDAEVVRWAKKYGFLNGANLTEVMDVMQKDGLNVSGFNCKNGSHLGVNYTKENILQSAISTGPVKIAIDADALPSGAGNEMGWYSVSSTHFGNTDHCVSLSGYGSAQYLYSQLGLSVPSGLAASTLGYLLFTWNSIGFVTHGWLLGTCVEAWIRDPTTMGLVTPPLPPLPPLPPSPPPTPNPGPLVVTGTATGKLVGTVKITKGLSAGTYPVTVSGTLPVTGSAQAADNFSDDVSENGVSEDPGAALESHVSLLNLTKDVWNLYSSIMSQNAEGLLAAVNALIVDVGLPVPHSQISAVSPNWGLLLVDAFALFAAISTKDPAAIVAAVVKLASDLGLHVRPGF